MSSSSLRFHLAIPLFALPLALPGCGTCSRFDLTRLVTSGRDGWQHPEQVVDALGLEPGQSVAEIGAGDGYWLPWLSRAVGPDGTVFAVEVESEKVATLRERVAAEGLTNVEVILGRYEDPLLPDGSVDLAMTCLTYHHIEEREVYFQRLQQALAPGGRVAHLDDRDDLNVPFRWLPTAGHTSNIDEMNAEMQEAGYRRTATFEFLPIQSFQIFAPVAVSPIATRNDRSGS